MKFPNESREIAPDRPLSNPKHEVFARELAKFVNMYDSARKAGYPEGSSFKPNTRRLSQRPDIRARVAYLQRVTGVAAAIDAKYVQQKLVNIVEAPLDPADVKVGDQLKALEMICKLNGLYAPDKFAPTNPKGDAPYDPLEINDDDRVRALEAFVARIKIKTEAA